jgi:hypothetical protein
MACLVGISAQRSRLGTVVSGRKNAAKLKVNAKNNANLRERIKAKTESPEQSWLCSSIKTRDFLSCASSRPSDLRPGRPLISVI